MENAHGVSCEDWREADPALLARLYADECRRWRESLDWDFAPSCTILERARRLRGLPGFVARDPRGDVAGWTFFVSHDGFLQVGGLVGGDDRSRQALLRAVLETPEARAARGVTCFLYPQSHGLREVLEQDGFDVQAHPYMSCALEPLAAMPVPPLAENLTLGPFIDDDPGEVVSLLSRSYDGSREARCFAPDLRLDQWAHYLAGLVETEACGRPLLSASFTLRDATRSPVAAALMTRIGERTAHLVQVVVDPAWRGRSLAQRLLIEGCRRLLSLGYSQLTLLVAEENLRARAVYRRLGFADRDVFFYGMRRRR
jgi:ribosomal protein S18 acetylase RimI-like enzyme